MSFPDEKDGSRDSASRFTPQASTAEDLLKSHTVGLVNLSDFRKRRAEALEQKEHEGSSRSGTATPSEGISSSTPPVKKKRKAATKGKLSFANNDDEETPSTSKSNSRAETPDAGDGRATPENSSIPKKKLGANASIGAAPKVMTKSALLREAQAREQLRKEYLIMQQAVKATEFLIPFVFYDGTNIPGGICKVKKGDHIWLFLDRSRKVGAELGVTSGGEKSNSRREWARVSVDDLMLVRGEIIIPHHYEFYYFIVNKTLGHNSTPLFPYSAETTTPQASISSSVEPSLASASDNLTTYDPLSRPKQSSNAVTSQDLNLEGAHEDPDLTKVVDRRWYERNKHIFPASVWEEFDPGKDYSKAMRRDAEGNAFFFS